MNSMSNSMDSSQIQIERDCVFGGLFQQIIFEMKNSAPLWDDLTTKSTKLHSCLRTTLQALTGFLEAFQKIADAATATKGATKDLGTALTRICLRHKAIEAKMKTFTSSFLDCLIIPLQERLEEWKKTTTHLDKEHAKEYKRARGELKKRSMETLRLQKKLKKGTSNGGTLPRSGGHHHHQHSSDMNSLPGGNRESNRVLELALRDTAEKKQAFEDAEKNAIRNALIEERSRFCLFVSYLKPVVDEEVAMLYELTHVQEAMVQLEKHAADPFALPPASEQVIADLKGSADGVGFCFQTPPSSPSSLGSRKSSMCSISSANSSSSSSAHSPSHQIHQRTILNKSKCHPVGATIRYSSVSSQDSGFTSQDALFSRMPYYDRCKGGNQSEGSNPSSSGSSNSSTPSSPYPPGSLVPTTNATWPNLQDSIQFERAACAIMNDRPHTISSAYERGHQRPPLTVYTFQGPMDGHGNSSSTTPATTPLVDQNSQQAIYQSRSEIYGVLGGRKGESKPPVPKRGSSLERGAPGYSASSRTSSSSSLNTPALGPKAPRGTKDMKKEVREVPLPDFNQSSDDMIVPQPVYVNMHELNQMASARRQLQQQQQQQDLDLPPPPPELMPPPPKVEVVDGRGVKSEGSLASSGYGSQGQIVMVGAEEVVESEDMRIRNGVCKCFAGGSSGYCTLPRNARHFTHCPLATSKHRLTNGNQGVVYGHLRVGSRRNSCGNQEKPPPPVRRNSAISSPAPSRGSSIPSSPIPHHVHQSMSVYGGNSSSSIPGTSSSVDSSETTPHASMEQLPPPPAYLITAEQRAAILLQQQLQEESRRISVAETIKSLTEKNHQPVSPNMVRKNLRQDEKSSSEHSSTGSHNNSPASPSSRSSSSSRRGSQGNTARILEEAAKTRATIMQVLNQKLANAQAQPTYGNLGQSPPNHHVQSNHGQNPQNHHQQQNPQQNHHQQQQQNHHQQQNQHLQQLQHLQQQQQLQHQNHQQHPNHNSQSNYSPQYVHKPQPLPPQNLPPQPLPPQPLPPQSLPPQNNYGHHPQQPNYPTQQQQQQNQQHYQPSNYNPQSNHQNNYSGQQHISYNHQQSNLQGNSYGQHPQGQNSHYPPPQSGPYSPNNSYSHSPPGQYQTNSYNNHSPYHPQQPGTPPNVPTSPPQQQQPIYERVDSAAPLPRSTPRRFSEELLKSTATFVQNRVLGTRTPPPVMTSKEIFVQTLNAKLSAMRAPSPDRTPPRQPPRNNMSNNNNSFAAKLAGAIGHHGNQGPTGKGNSVGEISTALRVRQWISSKTVSDPNICRESLMDQIRRGKKLRTTRAVNDRSAPRIQ